MKIHLTRTKRGNVGGANVPVIARIFIRSSRCVVVTVAELRRNLWDVAIVLLQLFSPKSGERFTSRPADSFYFVTFLFGGASESIRTLRCRF